ncbi:putative disease resistance RPP13-like protein 1 [Nicotiana sylvestris]|uniref:Disease resistance RPP13-like protein 1 n=2 Tax=Nicotiana TaxID=4085 RepID=A0A1S4ASR6_TOBAC|nr:PREDICTED: putative disease resistance RPP13-like protein 1 [Nicotiana sylvestris]XP_009785037.1 PREDICTED: putative disease resistance RPP13-like protein 1 [Nicotiana sylvestris]XP_016479729.1 PREDICTED: putative disease resistance RPP13-like protein 1 [Nicotiana tabacum]
MEIGLAVGGAFLSSALNVLFDRLAPRGDLLKMFQRQKHDFRLLEKLRRTLCGFQAVLSDAENKQASNPNVSQWLNELRDAVDSAENLIEEVNYEVLRLQVEGQHQNLSETSKQQVSDLNLCLSGDFIINIMEKLEYTIETLEELQKQIGHLGLKEYLYSVKQETRRLSTSVVDESDIFGRQNEIGELIDRILSVDATGNKLTVIPIVGMAGIGKTTLAKAVYNDEKVKDHFDLKAWFCVSEPYDAFRVTKGLLQEIGIMVDNNLNQLQVKLKESLKGKKFLIVLDDVWNDNYNAWDDLRNLFVQGDAGSTIIVTTRKKSVAKTMGNEHIRIDTLSSDVSWSLFKRHAFDNMDPNEHLEHVEVGKQIAAKCKGLPLALKTLAGMLRSKPEVEGWKRILRSEVWELPDNGILPALMLSYNDLPLHLKQCFSYCAIFPKDYPFRKKQVIQLWIANGLVQGLKKDETIKDLGNLFFLELQSRSLFERVPESSKNNAEKFLMHDLVNDLAQVASSKLCVRLEEYQESHMLKRSRHVSYSMGYGDFEKLEPLYKLEQLRTLLPIYSIELYRSSLSQRVLHNIFPRLTSLRALSLSHYHIKELPDVLFIKLKLLRFLDLSLTEIKQLPESICVLYNLETLLLSSCEFLEELPRQMEKLINLRHLDISGSSRLMMPLHLSKLKSLHVLLGAKFLLGDPSGSRMEDLGELCNLYGTLSIRQLENVADRREALKANMRGKEHIEKLSLEWSVSIADSSQNERDILGEIHPNPNIKELEINGYRGTNFPYWLADYSFSELVELSLNNCKDCYSLPAFGQLPSLKFLSIQGMHRIIEVTEEFYGSSSSKKPFNSLEKLEFAEMLEWEQWHALGNGEFPTLQELSIKNCPKLIGKLPENLRSLIKLKISKCSELNLETPIEFLSLKKFEVEGSPKVEVLFDHAELFLSQLQGMKQIVELDIFNCHSITSLPISILPSTLKRISIYDCRNLKLETSVSEMISSGSDMFLESLTVEGCDSIDEISPELVPRARQLRVESCHSLTRLLIPNGTEALSINGRFLFHNKCENLEILSVAQTTLLRTLDIMHCEKLKSLPEHMQELVPSLKELFLNNCPEIESFPEGGLPFNLEVLKIWNCKKLVNGRKEWGLQRLPCLTELTIYHDGSDEEIPAGENWKLPCSIRRITIHNLKTFSNQVLKSLTSLESLYTYNLPQIQSLLEEGLTSSLFELTLDRHEELHSLPTEGLRRITSLQRLDIRFCDQLQSITESALPSSLSKLVIEHCPKLQSLPVKGMPSSISELSIYRCPLLKTLLEFEKGDYWPNIAHIPTIRVDEEYL